MNTNKIFYSNETPQMLEAFKKAQSTFKYFWRELWWEQRRIVPALDMACVKAAFTQETSSEKPLIEYMWIGDIDFDGINVKGYLLNDPERLTNVKQGDFVEISISEISDWLFSIKSRAYGGFTIQVLRAEMDKKERKSHDNLWGLDFGEPDKILLAYEQDEHPEHLVEHPMSINMKEKLKEYLRSNFDNLVQKDEFGYTMLHREAIAGNKECVEVLIQFGADVNAMTNDGFTACDFANRLGWEHLIPVLQKL